MRRIIRFLFVNSFGVLCCKYSACMVFILIFLNVQNALVKLPFESDRYVANRVQYHYAVHFEGLVNCGIQTCEAGRRGWIRLNQELTVPMLVQPIVIGKKNAKIPINLKIPLKYQKRIKTSSNTVGVYLGGIVHILR